MYEALTPQAIDLLNRLAGISTKDAGTTPGVPLHGPGGLAATPGQNRQIANAMIMPRGLAGTIPVRKSIDTNSIYGVLTGLTASSGAEPTAACADWPMVGQFKMCHQTFPFGRQGRHCCDDPRQLQGVALHLVIVDQVADQSRHPSLFGADRLAGEGHAHRLDLAHRAHQPLGAADARHDADANLWLRKAGTMASNDDVAVHGQLGAAAKGVAAHRRHRGGRAVLLEQGRRHDPVAER